MTLRVSAITSKMTTTNANNKLSSTQLEVDKLRKKNEILERMSEERIRKIWLMYETDA